MGHSQIVRAALDDLWRRSDLRGKGLVGGVYRGCMLGDVYVTDFFLSHEDSTDICE